MKIEKNTKRRRAAPYSPRELDLENYALLRKFEALQHRHRGGPIEQASTESIRLLRHIEAQIRFIAEAQSAAGEPRHH